MKQAYIIIGGNGFMGRRLRTYLAPEASEMVVIGRSFDIPVMKNETYYSVATQSLGDIAAMLTPNQNYTIIDLAYTSVPNSSFTNPEKDFSENLHNVISNLDFARAINAERYLYVSSGGTVYGAADEYSKIPETANNFPLSPYGVTKMACERYVNMYFTIYGLKTLTVRPSNIYGPGQLPLRGQGFVATALGLAAQNKPVHIFGDGSVVRDYLYIDDFCSAVRQILMHGPVGSIVNIGYGEGYSLNEVVADVNEVLAGEGCVLQTVYEKGRAFDVKSNVLDITRLASFHWAPITTFKEGISKTWAWIKNLPANRPGN